MTKKAFTLVELLIVVSILGILGAIVFPEFQGQIQQSKEAAAKDILRILRNAIELYAAQNNDTPPGYPNNDSTSSTAQVYFFSQLVHAGEYLSERPRNLFNDSYSIVMLNNDDIFPSDPTNTDVFGWIYQPSTRTFKLNWPGTDSEGTSYFDY